VALQKLTLTIKKSNDQETERRLQNDSRTIAFFRVQQMRGKIYM
jgi:hypothetical protein